MEKKGEGGSGVSEITLGRQTNLSEWGSIGIRVNPIKNSYSGLERAHGNEKLRGEGGGEEESVLEAASL